MEENTKNNNIKYTYLKDYLPFGYEIPEIKIDFIIKDDKVVIKSEYNIIKKDCNSKSIELIEDYIKEGKALQILSIKEFNIFLIIT